METLINTAGSLLDAFDKRRDASLLTPISNVLTSLGESEARLSSEQSQTVANMVQRFAGTLSSPLRAGVLASPAALVPPLLGTSIAAPPVRPPDQVLTPEQIRALITAVQAAGARILTGVRAVGPAIAGGLGAGAAIGTAVTFPIAGIYELYDALNGKYSPGIFDTLLAEAIDDLLAELIAAFPGKSGCITDCIKQFRRDIDTGFDTVVASTYLVVRDALEDVYNVIRSALERFYACMLSSCGLDFEIYGDVVLAIFNPIYTIFLTILERRGDMSLFPARLQRKVRTGLREKTLKGRLSGYHRRGGFGFEEFGDDRDDNPDLKQESETTAVDPADLTINPDINLIGFTDDQLEMRKDALETLLSEASASFAALEKSLAGPGDAKDKAAQQIARGPALSELRRVKLALRNTLEVCRVRVQSGGDLAAAGRLAGKVRAIDLLNP